MYTSKKKYIENTVDSIFYYLNRFDIGLAKMYKKSQNINTYFMVGW